MQHNIIIPNAGDSIHSCEITKWHAQDSSKVDRGDLLLTLDTDKVSCEIEATFSGVLTHQIKEGNRAIIGDIAGFIEHDGSLVDEVIRDLTENQRIDSGEDPVIDAKAIMLKVIQYFLMALGILHLIKLIMK